MRSDASLSSVNAAGVRVEVLDDLTALAAHADRWDQLAEASPQCLPMLTHAWVASHLRHRLASGERWLCALAWDGEHLRGVLPVIVSPHRVWGHRRPYLTGIFDGHTRSGDALASPGNTQDTVLALVTAILDAEPRPIAVALRGVRDGSPTLEAVEAGIGDLSILRRRRSAGSYIPTEGSIEDFRSGLSANFKGNLRKARNKLAQLPAVETAFVAGEQATEAGLDRFLSLEASGWKGEIGTAIGVSPSLETFYRALCRGLAARGWLEWHELRSAGRLIAGHLAVRLGDSISLPKIAFDEDFARCAPGNLLMERCIERAFADDGIRQLNCLTDQFWHRNWRMAQEPYHDLSLFPRGPTSLLFGLMPAVIEGRARETLGPPLKRRGLLDGRRRRAGARSRVGRYVKVLDPARPGQAKAPLACDSTGPPSEAASSRVQQSMIAFR
jgi:CelD/BcsL family acetyltransferase involved in cellulose biosynthesis